MTNISGPSRDLPAVAERLTLLRCVSAVALHGSAMRAAESVFLSQPAVTRAILELENSCGVALFERGARGMVPTVVGARVVKRVDLFFGHLTKCVAEAGALARVGKRRQAAPDRFAGAVSSASLKALVAIAAAGTESNAARYLGLSQPAVNRSLRALEHLAGVALLQRSARGTKLTESGEALLRGVKLAFAEARAIESEVAAWRGELRGRVIVGALPLSVTLFLPQAIDAVFRQYPEIEITVVDGTYESLMQQLHQADIDAIVGALRPTPPDVHQELLFEEDLAVIVRAGHPCLDQPGLTLGDLLQWQWVIPLAGTPASVGLRRAFEAVGLPPPNRALQANNAPFTRAMIRDTDRLALTSYEQALDDERSGQFKMVPIPLQNTTRPIGMAVRANNTPSPDLTVVLQALRAAAARRKP
jgi:DNA-binding transcriptional LysR family regulator